MFKICLNIYIVFFFKTFLLLDELKSDSHIERDNTTQTGDCHVSINNVTARWDQVSIPTTLYKFNL